MLKFFDQRTFKKIFETEIKQSNSFLEVKCHRKLVKSIKCNAKGTLVGLLMGEESCDNNQNIIQEILVFKLTVNGWMIKKRRKLQGQSDNISMDFCFKKYNPDTILISDAF